MTDIITDFSDIAKRANLDALEGRPQNVDSPVRERAETLASYLVYENAIGSVTITDPGHTHSCITLTPPEYFYGVGPDGVTPVLMKYHPRTNDWAIVADAGYAARVPVVSP